jgi:DNA excision repair protein ERCC-4
MYEECSEEHKYLLGLRREKNAFTRLDRGARGTLISARRGLPPDAHPQKCRYTLAMLVESTSADVMIKTISTRFAGGRREISQVPSRVTYPIKLSSVNWLPRPRISF